MDYAWKVATAAGVVVNIVVIAAGGIAMGVHTSYGLLFAGNIAAAVVGLILELFFSPWIMQKVRICSLKMMNTIIM